MGRAMLFVALTTTLVLAVLLFMYRRARRVHPGTASSVWETTEPQTASSEPALDAQTAPVGYSEPNARMQVRPVVLAAALIIAALVAGALVARPAGDGDTSDAPSLAGAPTATAQPGAAGQTPAGASSQPDTTVQPLEGVDISRLRLPTLAIDAPIVALGVDPDGTMQSPDNPTDVAWYSFSARPGELSNVVMAGHLDYVNYGPAVFYRLKEARPGDELELVLVDGSVARYEVQGVTTYDEATAPVLEIVGPTEVETVTLITCGGSFDPLSREYDKRVVLRAERIYESALDH